MNTAIRQNTVRFILLIVLAVLFLCAGRWFHLDGGRLRLFLAGVPPAAAWALFLVLYVGITFFVWMGAKDLLRIVAALIFGVWISTALVWSAEMINVIVLFSLSRRLGRGFVQERTGGRMERIDAAVADTGFGGIFFLRALPVIPMRFLDLGFGLTGVRLSKYFLACLLATPLRIFPVQAVLAGGPQMLTDPVRLAGYLQANPWIMGVSFFYLAGSIVLVIVLHRRGRRLRRA